MSEIEIGLAAADEVALLPEIERRAATLFSSEDLPREIAQQVAPLADYENAQREARLLVARDRLGAVLGFAHIILLDGGAHLEELDVDPDFGQRGIGRSLVEAVCGWSCERGLPAITLSTFEGVPWNAPFYARLGFVPMPPGAWTDALRQLREHEKSIGLDIERRVIMRRPVLDRDLAFSPG